MIFHFHQLQNTVTDDDVTHWINFINKELNLAIDKKEFNQRSEKIPVSFLLTHFDNFVKNIKPLI